MKAKIYVKTQTSRSTNFKEGISNINMGIKFNGSDFEFGVCAVKYWGDLSNREEPLLTFEVEGKNYEILLSDFIKEIKPILNKSKYNNNKYQLFKTL